MWSMPEGQSIALILAEAWASSTIPTAPHPRPRIWRAAFSRCFKSTCQELGIKPKLILEPGRSIVADTTIMLTSVNVVKRAHVNFVAVDAGFNVLARPVLYDSYHHVVVANKAGMKAEETYTVVGPICETGDVLAKDRRLPRVERGDVLAFLDAGAYGFPWPRSTMACPGQRRSSSAAAEPR